MIKPPLSLTVAVLNRDDISAEQADLKIQTMSLEQRLNEFLEWEGIHGYTRDILRIVSMPVLPERLLGLSLDTSGNITTPGKFQGLPLFVPYLYEGTRDGYVISETGPRQIQYDITDEDIRLFPELRETSFIIVSEEDSGVDFEAVRDVE